MISAVRAGIMGDYLVQIPSDRAREVDAACFVVSWRSSPYTSSELIRQILDLFSMPWAILSTASMAASIEWS
jgi:hypothetical protein